MDYEEIIQYFYNSIPNYHKYGAKDFKPGLEKIQDLLEAIGNPQNELKFIHVAGTNGKGSTCSFLAHYLSGSAYKTGLFTSPHLFDFRERIRINDGMISKEFISDFFLKYKEIFDLQQPSFFELTFALALDYFRHEKVDICVIETGLGGRLDATNIVQPLVAAITNIGIDHTEFLGNTIKEIAIEKGGIIKNNTPVALGEMRDEAKQVLELIAEENNSSIIEIAAFPIEFENYQQKNLNLAKSVLEHLKNSGWDKINLNLSLNKLQIFGRYYKVQDSPTVIIDVAHNLDGFENLLEQEELKNCANLSILFGGTQEKNLDQITATFPKNSKIYFSSFSNARTLHKEDFEHQESIQKFQYFDDPEKAYQTALKEVASDGTLLVCGSFYLIADLKPLLDLQS